MPEETAIDEPDTAHRTSPDDVPDETGTSGQEPLRDRHAWRTTLIVWVVLATFSVGWMFFFGINTTAFLRGKVPTPGLWLVPGDLWTPVDAGRTILFGALAPYTDNPYFVAMPLYAVVMLPVSTVVSLFNIPPPEIPQALLTGILDSTQLSTFTASATSLDGMMYVPRSEFAPVAVGYVLLWAIPFLKTVRSLASALGARRRLWALQVSAFFLCWFPAVLSYGHLEDGLLATLLMYGVVLALRREWLQLAFILSIALSLKQTAALAVPLFFVFVPKGHRLRFAAATAALPALLLALVIITDATSVGRSLLNPPTWPGVGGGRTALFITSDEPILRAGPYRYGAPLIAVALAVWLRRNRSVPLLVAGLALTAAARLPFEAVLHMYYATPLLLLAAIYEKGRRGNAVFATIFGLGSLLLFWIGGIPDWAFWPTWVALTAAATWPVWVDVARRRFGGPPENDLLISEAGFGTDGATSAAEDSLGGQPDVSADGPGPLSAVADADSDVRTSAPADGVIL